MRRGPGRTCAAGRSMREMAAQRRSMREMAGRRRGPEACAVSTYAPRAGGLIQARLPLVFGLKPPMGDLMTRTLAIRRSALGVTVGLLLAAMTLAAAALAAKPAHGAHFTGRTAAAPVSYTHLTLPTKR